MRQLESGKFSRLNGTIYTSFLFNGNYSFSRKQTPIDENDGTWGILRWKRQVFTGEKYKWKEGINYKFDEDTSEHIKKEFTRAAKAWSQDTCVDIRLNSSGNARQNFTPTLEIRRFGRGSKFYDQCRSLPHSACSKTPEAFARSFLCDL
ncbi:hypothetical protein Y032_0273g987 [Ancylostoma ceylanicum]|uniref:Peptidase M12A domain-containing protein n=1 Tax=Ancylostoma ceylanicum TaxID=53326 RepID=A0A016S936_9BILA|nr:hypothetical protein Y032_0273g987 [Ancylostoma ceylanicum]